MENKTKKQYQVKTKGYSEFFNEEQKAYDKYFQLKNEVFEKGGFVKLQCRLIDNELCVPVSDWLLVDSIIIQKNVHK